MRAVHFDPFSGASGDMVLGALADAGASGESADTAIAALEGALARTLPFDVSLAAERVVRRGIAGTRVEVVCKEAHAPHRGLGDLLDILAAADLPSRVRELSERTFRALAAAEAAVHGTTVDEVRFHEIGAADTLVDVIGAHWLVEKLGCPRVTSGPVAVGSGTVVAAHGELPVPAPATAELLKDVPLRGSSTSGELTTPTGAALLVTLAQSFGPMPPMKVAAIGYGFGSRQDGPGPNALRVFVGEAVESAPGEEEVAVIETTVDDMPGEWLGRLFGTLSGRGALEVSTTPVGMKKSRPGVRVTVVARASDARGLAEALLRETTTFGVRLRTERRIVLDR
ncbi:MAG: nickel pincer cofactor biosynthesis protein LarC, partial [Planctomycetota bacterium]